MNEQPTTQSKNRKPLIGILVAAIVLLGGGITAATVIANSNDSKEKISAQTQQDDQSETENKNANLVTFTAVADKTVLEQLQVEADTVETKDSDYGPYVDSINGVVGGTGGKYWTFYVDGQMANIGAAEYKTKGGEKIEWKFE